MYRIVHTRRQGFTLVELLVVIGIIGLLAGVVLASLSSAREGARDKKRVTDLGQIQLAIKLYSEANGEFPCQTDSNCSVSQGGSANGRVGTGGTIDTLLQPYLPSVPGDPKGPDDSTFNYYYDGRHACGGVSYPVAIVFAKNMETDEFKDNETICSSYGNEGGASDDSYRVILGPSSG